MQVRVVRDAVGPVGLDEVRRSVRHDDDAGEQVDITELTEVVPRHQTPHRPAHHDRSIQAYGSGEGADIPGVLSHGVAALLVGRCAMAAAVYGDDAIIEGQVGDVAPEEHARHGHTVEQHDCWACALIRAMDGRAAGRFDEEHRGSLSQHEQWRDPSRGHGMLPSS